MNHNFVDIGFSFILAFCIGMAVDAFLSDTFSKFSFKEAQKRGHAQLVNNKQVWIGKK